MSRLEVGQQAPDFTLESTEGTITLSQLLKDTDMGVVVYFYPKAMTPGCTTEACDFRDNLNTLKAQGYTVVGISPDKISSLENFRDKHSLNFPLASDPDKKVLEEWGAFGERKIYGKTSLGVIRSTVVISPNGTVKLPEYNVKAKGHVAKLRKDLGID